MVSPQTAGQTDEEVYTAFFATVIGAVRSAQFFSMLQAGMSDGNGAVAVDAGKAALYGWRPLEELHDAGLINLDDYFTEEAE